MRREDRLRRPLQSAFYYHVDLRDHHLLPRQRPTLPAPPHLPRRRPFRHHHFHHHLLAAVAPPPARSAAAARPAAAGRRRPLARRRAALVARARRRRRPHYRPPRGQPLVGHLHDHVTTTATIIASSAAARRFVLLVSAEPQPLHICTAPPISCHGLLPPFGRRYLRGLPIGTTLEAYEAVWGERWAPDKASGARSSDAGRAHACCHSRRRATLRLFEAHVARVASSSSSSRRRPAPDEPSRAAGSCFAQQHSRRRRVEQQRQQQQQQ